MSHDIRITNSKNHLVTQPITALYRAHTVPSVKSWQAIKPQMVVQICLAIQDSHTTGDDQPCIDRPLIVSREFFVQRRQTNVIDDRPLLRDSPTSINLPACTHCSGINFDRRLPTLPSARAAASPALVLSTISSHSISASTPIT